jgi:hypothetical protein
MPTHVANKSKARQIILRVGVFVFRHCKITKAVSGMAAKINHSGAGKPISHFLLGILMSQSQASVTLSRVEISHIFGTWASSKKKIKQEIQRKAVKKGLKMRLPIGANIDMGKPQEIRIGKEIRDKNS